MSLQRTLIACLAAAFFTTAAAAQGGTGSGPVAAACQADIAKYCAGKEHGNRAVRTCLEENRDKVTEACRTALDTTGGGRGQGRNRQ
jgi:hypothetical protein